MGVVVVVDVVVVVGVLVDCWVVLDSSSTIRFTVRRYSTYVVLVSGCHVRMCVCV